MGMTRRVAVGLCVVLLSFTTARAVGAADTWTEVKSPHFTVWSNAGDGATRTLVWQFEQIRSAMTILFPWAKVDLAKPMVVIAAKDEQAMKALAPKYWEQRGGIRPSSVWVSGADRHYMAIRADLHGDDTNFVNPYTSSYFSYASLIIAASFNRALPPWFLNGLAGVLSNTIVRSNYILLGPPIPWHLDALRQDQRFPLKQLVSITDESPEYVRDSGRERFDAQAWAFVHLLMFGEQGKYQTAINRFSSLLVAGKAADAAFAEAIGPVSTLESSFASYIHSSLYSYQRATVDGAVKRERFAARPLPPAESAGLRASFQVAMGRNTEARALIDEARKLDSSAADGYAAEGMLFDRDDKPAEAKQAYAKAAELGSTNAYVHYRAAASWGPGAQPDQTALQDMDAKLARAIQLNPLFAVAYTNLAEVRATLKKPLEEVAGLLGRAVALEPGNAWHRIAVARVLWRYDRPEDARAAAKLALTLADTDQARSEAQRLLSSIK
jgi:tetratricopeptide (TPR) repeat protein